MDYEIEFLEDFRDGNILPGLIKRGTFKTVSELTYKKIKQSAPYSVIVRGKLIPPPSQKCESCGAVYSVEKEHTCETND